MPSVSSAAPPDAFAHTAGKAAAPRPREALATPAVRPTPRPVFERARADIEAWTYAGLSVQPPVLGVRDDQRVAAGVDHQRAGPVDARHRTGLPVAAVDP